MGDSTETVLLTDCGGPCGARRDGEGEESGDLSGTFLNGHGKRRDGVSVRDGGDF